MRRRKTGRKTGGKTVCKAALACLVCLLATVAAEGQGRTKPQQVAPATPATAPAAPAAAEPAPPYEVPLLRLAEVLGTLSYMRDLCGFGDGAEFRARMSTLLDSEASGGARRDRIAGYFNRGFREYEALHRTCTPVSREVTMRAMEEGGRLAREIGSRFGGS